MVYGAEAAFLVLVLAILEISLSMDNAVVNASVLKDMTPIWQKCFMTWGIVIAVFGMRLVLPGTDRRFRNELGRWRCHVNGAQVTCRIFTSFKRSSPSHCLFWRHIPADGRSFISS